MGRTSKTFAFVDLAGFTALTEAHGDEAGADLAKRFERMVEASLGFGDELVAMVGDAAFVASPKPDTALEFLEKLWKSAEAETDFPTLRAGLHHGEAASRGGNYFGTAVNIAARIAGEAAGGQVVASGEVVGAAEARGIHVRPLGPTQLKNLRQAIELFSLEWERRGSLEVVDPVCRMRVVAERAEAHLELRGREYWFCSRDCLKVFLGEGGR